MVFVLPSEFRAPQPEELAVAQLDLGPQPIIFEKPKEKSYKHLNGLYLKGLIDGKPVNRMLVDTGAAVNLMPLCAAPIGSFFCGSDQDQCDA